jgi:hypothetical protein
VGHSLTLLTAALLVGQTQMLDSSGRPCPCKNGQQGRVLAQPEMVTETRTTGWWNGRSSTTTTETWSSGVQQTGWVDNRPVLSRIKSWFGRGETSGNSRSEAVQPSIGQPITPPATTNELQYRRLPTTNEPPLNSPAGSPASSKGGAAPTVQPKPAAPATQKPGQINAPPAAPLTIEVEPIEFRPAGSAKIGTPTVTSTMSPPVLTVARPSNRPNHISPRFTDKVGQPGDYSWITGQLEVRNGAYIIHYATPETVDQHNGSLQLAVDAKALGNVRNGDLVSVHGNVVQQSGRTLYRVQGIDLIER